MKRYAAVAFMLYNCALGITFSCDDIRIDKKSFDLEKLGGPHQLWQIRRQSDRPGYHNTTFTFDICGSLAKQKVPKEEDCPNNTRVCAIERYTNSVENQTTVTDTVPIAGDYTVSGHGGALDPQITRLKDSASNSDHVQEGLRLELHGGRHDKQSQKAIIEFLCPKSHDDRRRDEDDDDDDGLKVKDGHGGKIKFVSWDVEDSVRSLRLSWKTKYACEDGKHPSAESGSHWGFFTWFIVIIFMGIAAYLIFGSWLNYNRYSARGWDLLPHSETIRDLPYLMQDWIRRIVANLQGHNSRGGYSAV